MDDRDPQPATAGASPPHPALSARRLDRRLGVGDALVIGLGAMVGAGAFAAFAPAAEAAGAGLLLGLAVAAAVAYCNAMSSARLAALYPESGGTYVYGRERLGAFWGHLAGWGFVVGKTASCAAMALTVGHYVAPDFARPIGIATVVALTALNYFGVHKSALATRVIVSVVLATLAALVAAGWTSAHPQVSHLVPVTGHGVHGVLQAAGFLFFAFAGYARIATLGEEVRDPARTIPRAIPVALAITLVVYAGLAVTVLAVLGPTGAAATPAPLVAVAEATPWAWLVPVVRAGAAIAAFGSLLALVLGVSRTVLAMSRDRHLPGVLDAVHPRHGVPHRAQLAVGVVVIAVVLVADVRGAIGFSSVAVLGYYAIANASALTLDRDRGIRLVPVLGLVGCLVVAVSLPLGTVISGVGVLAAGALVWVARRSARGT